MSRASRWKSILLIALAASLVAGLAGIVLVLQQRRGEARLAAELAEIRDLMERRRFAVARQGLQTLAAEWPARGEVFWLLGRCEEETGRKDQAAAAWEQVPLADDAFPRAAEALGHLLIGQGKYAPAEEFLWKALAAARPAARPALLRTLTRLLRLQGRFPEVSAALKAAWLDSENPAETLQELWQNDNEPVPVEGWKIFLDAADAQDDRVWLGRARHAIIIGAFSEAASWLERCLDRRPDDPVLWRAALDLAVAAEDPARFWTAAGRLARGALPPQEIAALRCWLASRTGDRRAEQREWTSLLEHQPGSSRALDRLAELTRINGDPRAAEAYQRRKAEIDRAWDQIHKMIIRRVELGPHARDLSRLCGTLGRRFEEHAWLLVAARRETAAHDQPADLERARESCRAVAEQAFVSLLPAEPAGAGGAALTLAAALSDWKDALSSLPARHEAPAGAPDTAAARLRFVDDAEAAGLHFVYDSGRSPQWLLPESLSGGVGLVDFDGDGWLDVYCLQGGTPQTSAPGQGSAGAIPAGDRLFRNQRDGRFQDVTARTGLEGLLRGKGYGMGIAVGDYDNDGHADLFLTRLEKYVLLRNRGDGSFEDRTEASGLVGPRENPTSAAFADLDNDGDLDLYVCHYARWNRDDPPRCENEKGEPYYCDPAKYEAALDHVFRNDGGRFVDVTEEAGFTDPDGRGLGVVAADLDGDGLLDLFVANDGTANFLFRNRGNFRFEEVGLSAGTAGNAEGGFRAGMGVVAADIDGDGRLDVLVNNLHGEGSTFYRNLGEGLFADHSSAVGILQATRYLTGFGVGVLDPGNDGRLHIATANGHVNDFRPFYPFAMPGRLYESRGGRLVDVSERAGEVWSVPRLGRGLAVGDLDNDGRVDLLIVSQNERLVYLHNRSEKAGHFVVFRLEGRTSNRDAVGARITLEAGGRKQAAYLSGGGSYLAAGDPRIHFGIGSATRVETVEVNWPSGRVDRWHGLAADTGYRLQEETVRTRTEDGFLAPGSKETVPAKTLQEDRGPRSGPAALR